MIYKCLGLMSGTSLDGVDGAVCVTDGSKIIDFQKTFFRPYTSNEQKALRSKLNTWPESINFEEEIEIIHRAHLDVIKHFPDVDLVGFHGQTLNHDPKSGRTFQLGNGALLAKKCGKKVIWDFRTADIVNGGEGAPLAPFFHFACAKLLNIEEAVAFVNLGGVSNISVINKDMENPEDKGAVIAFDTGPANAPINDFMMNRLGKPFDKNGFIAQSGIINKEILNNFLDLDYFKRKPPKSLDRNDFSFIMDLTSKLSTKDGVATLTAICVETIVLSQKHLPIKPLIWLISGGGRHNKAIMDSLKNRLNGTVMKVEDIGLDGDMIEAQAFGYLAARVINNLPTSGPSTTGCSNPTIGGRISKP